ncbi:hypothetical protein NQ166_07800, partial [Microbacterium sp. zg.Y1090]|uniref:hypothetical protein n=1 Tax=Microbacterium wangruii TaxID=3049073 RepID=UPI00214D9274
VGCDGRVSASILSARSRISGEYFLFIVFHPYLKNGTKVRPIQFAASSAGPEGHHFPTSITQGRPEPTGYTRAIRTVRFPVNTREREGFQDIR